MSTEGEIVAERLRLRAQELADKGDLLSEEKLKEFYGNFAEHFGPRQLQSLDGERLLNTMHDVTDKNALPYWLEFKNDDEFRTLKFGSIAGGSALKFGIFKKKETGAWTTGSPANQVQVSTDAAIDIARKHRNQLLEVCKLLDDLTDDASDPVYARLQSAIETKAPDLCDLAWAHKYFGLLYPKRLDDYHNENYQRFHLIRALQLPPEAKGRYVCAGRFVELARTVGLPIVSLTAAMNSFAHTPYRYWRIGTREGDDGTSVWQQMRDGSYVSVGWPKLGDLGWLLSEDPQQWVDKLRPVLAGTYPNAANVVTRETKEIVNFLRPERIDDIVAAADGARVLGVARVRGPYQYNAALRFPHFRQVEWLGREEWKLPQQECLRTTFSEFKKYDVNRLEMERRILIPAAPSTPRTSAPEASAAIEPEIEEIHRLLAHKPQIILYGPPGTGKTYWAKEAARELASRANFGLSYKQLPDSQRRQLEDPVAGFVRTCSFHPGYGYEDFLEGYRPNIADGQLFFEEKTGIFKQLCKDAHAAESKTYYLIIDEINRGDLPRIFGELMTVLEKDKRGVQVILPVSGQSFWVPNNVFIIATMNTADRSISLLDVALRRRFGFIEILPKPALLKSVIQGLPVGPWLDAVNQRIRSLLGTDGRNLQIGHSYFMPNAQQVRSLQDFGQIFRYEVFPLLEEYCYGKYEVLERIFGKSLVDSSEQRLRIEMFEKGREDELVHALLADFPAVITTEEAVSEEGVSEDLAAPEDSEKDDGL